MVCPSCKRKFYSKIDTDYIKNNTICRECDTCFIEEEKYITITREMALDAGFPEMEGQLWRW